MPSIPAFLICDAAFIRKYGLGNIHPGTRDLAQFERSGYLVGARTLDELAGKIGVDAAGLRDTVARHNRFAETGVDVDFGKGERSSTASTATPRTSRTPASARSPRRRFMRSRSGPPTSRLVPGLPPTRTRACSTPGKPIPGLYACGNDMASVMGGSYPGPGTTLGPALVFAYRAVMHAAGKAPLEEPIAGG